MWRGDVAQNGQVFMVLVMVVDFMSLCNWCVCVVSVRVVCYLYIC